nr:Protein R03C1.1, isoform b [Haemonchus contortus]
MYQKTLALLCIWFCVAQAIQENPITLRVKRQECKCIRNPRSAGSMTCSCAKPMSQLSPNSVENIQQTEVAQALSDSVQAHPSQSQARCGCVQIVYLGTAQYQCQCGETPTTTTTTEAPTTLPPTTPVQYPSPSTNGPGQCQCVMIQISGPSSAQYQCNCHGNQVKNKANNYYLPDIGYDNRMQV